MTKPVNRPHLKPGPKGKLTPDEVEILRARGSAPRKILARQFGISVETIRAIRSGRLWASKRAQA